MCEKKNVKKRRRFKNDRKLIEREVFVYPMCV